MIPDIIIQMVDPVDGKVIAQDYGFQFIVDNEHDEIVVEAVEALRDSAEFFPVGWYNLQVKPATDAS